jgi:eukaryotic-like serine/threonine-protein kinase
VTLIDLGLVLARAEDAARPGLTREGVLVGTAEYMAPEQCDARSRSAVDARADVYATGVILHEMLVGHPPFWGPPAVVHETEARPRVEPPGVPKSRM